MAAVREVQPLHGEGRRRGFGSVTGGNFTFWSQNSITAQGNHRDSRNIGLKLAELRQPSSHLAAS